MDLQRRLYVLTGFIIGLVGIGIAGFWFLGRLAGAEPNLLECAYQTVITLSTVGNKTPQLAEVWYGKVFIIILVLLGMGALFVFATTVTAFFVEGEIRNIFRRKKMDKALQELSNHVIVCGAGDTGAYVIEELIRTGHPMVIVDEREERIQRILDQHPGTLVPFVIGQAADDEVLNRAGLDRARGIVVALPDDRDNLFVTVTAKQTNPKVRIVARAADAQAEQRLARTGADAVVSPSRIGGMRMASEMVRPEAVGFLDSMLRGREKQLRIEELHLGSGCSIVGQALRDTSLRKDDLLVLAVREPTGIYVYNPPPEYILELDATLIVLGSVESVRKMKAIT